MPFSDIVAKTYGMNNADIVAFLSPILAPLRISFDDIVSATNNFANDHFIKRGNFSDVYKGKLLWSKKWIDVVIRRYLPSLNLGDGEFLKMIKEHSELNHRNTLSIVGFCCENGEKVMVFEYQHNGSLDRYLSDPTALTWSQRLKICQGAASFMRYIHDVEDRFGFAYDHEIKSSKIFLDRDWEAKVFCFGFRMPYYVSGPYSKSSYTDPEYGRSHKSDVYSFGVILFEVICGKKAEVKDGGAFARMAKQHYEKGNLDDIINPDLRKQMHPLSLSILSHIAYNCLQKRKKRPRMNFIVEGIQQTLELPLKKENLEKEYAFLKIPLSDVMSATKNFDTTYCVGSQSDAMVYKAHLDHYDINSWLTIERMNKELPKMHGEVIIKHIINHGQVAKGFIQEIKMLAGCMHSNIVSLLGFSWEGSEMILVYQSPFNGSLHDYLGSSSKTTNLTWEQRIQICHDIAVGLTYLRHRPNIIPQGICSANVLLDEKWNAKIANFRLPNTDHMADTYVKSDRESNIYSFGVILFEILCGKLDNDPIRLEQHNDMELVDPMNIKETDYKGLALIARKHFIEGTLKKLVDPKIMEEVREYSYTTKIGPDQDSLDTFARIAYQCLSESEAERPTEEVIIKSLEKALHYQVGLKHLEIQLDVILSATNRFDGTYCIGSGAYGEVYKAELYLMNEDNLPRNRTVAIKRIKHREDRQGNTGFLAELELLSRCENPNILRLLGFCVKGPERILVYEHASNGSLDDYLKSTDKMINLTWDQRLKMCLGIAYGLNYLHKTEGDKRVIIHRDIKSDNILLDENLEVKIADFGLSVVHPTNHPEITIHTNNLAGTDAYADPEYMKTGKLKVESDIYSFGVVLFEILSGKSAYDSFYTYQYEKGLAPVAREHFSKGTIMEMVDATIMNEAHELSSTLRIGPDQRSLDAFCKVAYECLAETQVRRPKMEVIIEELKKALHFQEHRKDTLKISLENISFDETFSDNNCNIDRGLGMVYNNGEGPVLKIHDTYNLFPIHDFQWLSDDIWKAVVVKRLRRSGLEPGIWRDFEIPFKHRHENIVSLVGYCKKMDEKFIVYEYASNQSLDLYLNDANFSWTKRLKICIDIANGLDFLHRCDVGQEVVIHRDMKSSNILLKRDWKAKISGFEVSLICPINQEIGYVVNDVVGSPGYCDPLYWDKHFLTKESDIYSFGVILFEVLCGRLACRKDSTDPIQFLDDLVKHQHRVGRAEDIVFDGIKEQIVRESLVTFRRIAIQCLHDEIKERPTAGAVLEQLQKALEFQEDIEIWEKKLPINYIEILQLSISPEIYSTMWKKDIYNMFCKGIPLQDGKLWFSIGSNGERNEMISATTFSYKNRWSHRWRSIQESRFRKVAEMLDITNLNIQIKKSTQLLLPGVNYSVHLVFKFCCPRKSHAKRMYVNLRYKMGNENLNAYFATLREDGWMMIELCRFSNQKEETNVDVLLESFSRCYCDSRAIYIEGIEFRALDNVKQEEIMKSGKIQQVSNSEMDKSSSSMRTEVPAEQVLYETSNKKLSLSNLSFQSRSEGGGIKLLTQQVFRIYCNIGSQMESPNTDGVCYLVFKLSESCSGLHCPVIIRDQSNRRSKETGILYFRSPSPWNLAATDRVPKERGDGWMEVKVGIFNSDCRFLNLKLITYEGTMSGLIVRGLEFRPS